MSREEFLEILNIQLQGEIPSNEISQHLAYYHNFIEQKIRQGQSEANVLEELGDPRLIAKTLIDTEDVPNVRGYRQNYAYSAEEAKDQTAQEEEPQENFTQKSSQQESAQWEAFQWENFQEESTEQESSQQKSFQQETFQQESPRPGSIHWLDTSTWYGKLAVIAGAVLIAILLFLIIGALLPVAAVLVIVGILFSWINRRR